MRDDFTSFFAQFRQTNQRSAKTQKTTVDASKTDNSILYLATAPRKPSRISSAFERWNEKIRSVEKRIFSWRKTVFEEKVRRRIVGRKMYETFLFIVETKRLKLTGRRGQSLWAELKRRKKSFRKSERVFVLIGRISGRNEKLSRSTGDLCWRLNRFWWFFLVRFERRKRKENVEKVKKKIFSAIFFLFEQIEKSKTKKKVLFDFSTSREGEKRKRAVRSHKKTWNKEIVRNIEFSVMRRHGRRCWDFWLRGQWLRRKLLSDHWQRLNSGLRRCSTLSVSHLLEEFQRRIVGSSRFLLRFFDHRLSLAKTPTDLSEIVTKSASTNFRHW